jgi:hypothetical protein
MNPCRSIQRRLLAVSAPDDPPSAVREHLEGCADCREWRRRVVHLERNVGLLPVAPSTGRDAFLRDFRSKSTRWDRLRTRVRLTPRWQLAWGVAAASVLLMVSVLSFIPTPVPTVARLIDPVAPDPLVAKLYQRDLDLAAAVTPRQQVETLAYLAEDLRTESRGLASTLDGKEPLKALAGWYGEVVHTVVEESEARASGLPAAERQAMLAPVERLLARATDDADRTATEYRIQSANHPLSGIANTARNAHGRIVEILGEKASSLPHHGDPLCRRSSSVTSPLVYLSHGAPALALAAAGEEVRALGQATEQVKRFRRNQPVIQALVSASLELAVKLDPADRAAVCATLAHKLGDEIRLSVPANPARALELGPYVGDLLKRGVAENMAMVPASDPRSAKLLPVGSDVRTFTRQLDQDLAQFKDADAREAFQRVLRTIAFGREEVEKTLQGRGAY